MSISFHDIIASQHWILSGKMKSAPIGHYIDHHSLTSLSWTFSGICSNDPLFFRINTQSLLIYHINTKADRETNACFVFISVRCQDTLSSLNHFLYSLSSIVMGKRRATFGLVKMLDRLTRNAISTHTHRPAAGSEMKLAQRFLSV